MAELHYLFSPVAAGLHLGPNDEVTFRNHFAQVDVQRYPRWSKWAAASPWPVQDLGVIDEPATVETKTELTAAVEAEATAKQVRITADPDAQHAQVQAQRRTRRGW